MSISDILAIIGAAAWLPQICQWIYNWVAKPKLKVVVAPTVEVGYTTFGPIVNLTTSISVERRDALIHKIVLAVSHEKGEKRQLTWKWLNETQHQIRTFTGEMAEVTKNQPAVALKVSTLALAEKLIGFQDLEFLARAQEEATKIGEQYKFLQGQVIDPTEALMKSKEFTAAQDSFFNEMYWKEGKYIFEVQLYEVRLAKPHTERFTVVFSKNDIEMLRANTTQLQTQVRATLTSNAGAGQEVHWPRWNWIYPSISPAN